MDPEPPLRLLRLPGSFAVARLSADAPFPAWANGLLGDGGAGRQQIPAAHRDLDGPALLSVTRTADELSVVCEERLVPPDVRAERGFAALRVEGVLDFSLVGVLARLTKAVAAAGVPAFALSTFDTDILLLPGAHLARAVDALERAGIHVSRSVRGGSVPRV